MCKILKKITLLSLFLFAVISSVLSFSYYGKGNQSHQYYVWRTLEKTGIESSSAVKDLIGKAIQLGVDNYKQKDIASNIRDLSVLGIKFPNAKQLEFKASGQNHHAFNHQGFNFDYVDDAVKRQRWSLGKNRVIVPVVSKVLGLRKAEGTFISSYLVADHYLGDIMACTPRTINQMGKTGTPYGVLDDLLKSVDNYETLRAGHKLKGANIIPMEEMSQLKDELLRIQKNTAIDVLPNSDTDLLVLKNNAKHVSDDISDTMNPVLKHLGTSKDALSEIPVRKSQRYFSIAPDLGVGLFTLALYVGTDWYVNGLENINWTNAGVISSLAGVGNHIARKFMNSPKFPKGWKGGIALFAIDMAVDTFYNSYLYFTHQQTGHEFVSTELVNKTGSMLSLGTTWLFSNLGSHFGPVGTLVGTGVGFVASVAVYAASSLGWNYISNYYEVKDILADMMDDYCGRSENIMSWTEEYLSSQQNQNTGYTYEKLISMNENS